MARDSEKEPGRLKTMWSIFQMTRRNDRAALPLMLLALLGPIALVTVLAIVLRQDPLFFVLWIISGVLIGLMLMMMVLTWRAEKIAFAQIEGRPGAVGAVLKNGLRGNWTTSEMPVAVNPRTQDAIYRAVGKPGVVLIAEGPRERVARLLADEQRKVKRIVPNVPIHVVEIGPDSTTPLRRLTRTMRRLKRTLSRAEVMAVANRLTSLGQANLPIPKGIDPRRVRPGRPR
ncbi:DUF4191 family protein [Agrococcus sediminis]|uniref:DUF4191 family protein n=1 Tax=Agrococcus sediminis TaxID=2599924 RepID=A0A5M8QFT6_9MICO|nr:DUF4191 domain-containing protein [Agrococcus sediminis]KAA6433824.1 DUF4191 family protein [Agrococcus sediminis]RWR25575.1 DUF4191 family protein [Agrococcus lahaulensis]